MDPKKAKEIVNDQYAKRQQSAPTTVGVTRPVGMTAPVPAPSPAPAPAPAPVASTTTTTTSSSSSSGFTNTRGIDVQGYDYKLKDNLRNGDCFFSAIYQSLVKWDAQKSGALLKVIHACDQRFIVDKGEGVFITSARNILADQILAGGLEPIYNRYLELFITSPQNIRMVIQDYQAYFQRILLDKLNKQKNPNQNFYSLDEFSRLIAGEIRKPGTWVSELEVNLFREILKPCKIILDWYSDTSVMPALLPKMHDTYFILNLYVIRGVHWQHYELSGKPKNIRLQRLEHSFLPATTRGGRRASQKTRHRKSRKRLNKSRKHK